MKNDTRIQSVVSNTQPKEPGFQGGTRTVWVVRASFEIRRLRRLSRGSADPRESYPKLATSSKLPCPRESPWKPGSFGVRQTTTFHFHF